MSAEQIDALVHADQSKTHGHSLTSEVPTDIISSDDDSTPGEISNSKSEESYLTSSPISPFNHYSSASTDIGHSALLDEWLATDEHIGEYYEFLKASDVPFETIRYLGNGTFGVVEEVRHLPSKKVFARKKMRVRSSHDMDKITADVRREIAIIRHLRHSHVVSILGTYREPKSYCIIMLPVADGDLEWYLEKCADENYPEKMLGYIQNWYACLSSALAFIHAHRVRHRDIKPGNILVSGEMIFYTDFGIAKDFSTEATSSTHGTTYDRSPMYSSPEVMAEHGATKRSRSADVFSLGCVFSEMTSVLNQRSVSAFWKFRVNESNMHAYYLNLDKVEAWFATTPFYATVIAPMLRESRTERITTQEVAKYLATYGLNGKDGLLCNHVTLVCTESLRNLALEASEDLPIQPPYPEPNHAIPTSTDVRPPISVKDLEEINLPKLILGGLIGGDLPRVLPKIVDPADDGRFCGLPYRNKDILEKLSRKIQALFLLKVSTLARGELDAGLTRLERNPGYINNVLTIFGVSDRMEKIQTLKAIRIIEGGDAFIILAAFLYEVHRVFRIPLTEVESRITLSPFTSALQPESEALLSNILNGSSISCSLETLYEQMRRHFRREIKIDVQWGTLAWLMKHVDYYTGEVGRFKAPIAFTGGLDCLVLAEFTHRILGVSTLVSASPGGYPIWQNYCPTPSEVKEMPVTGGYQIKFIMEEYSTP